MYSYIPYVYYIYVYTYIHDHIFVLLHVFNLYIAHFEIYDLCWVFPKGVLETKIQMQIIHLGDDLRKSQRRRGKTEIGAREKPSRCTFINRLLLWSTMTQSHCGNF